MNIFLITMILWQVAVSGEVAREVPVAQKSPTQVVLLGTGTPNADPDTSGPAVAIVVNDTPYVVDAGPGVVRRAAAAARKGVAGLQVSKLRRLFLTHLHSDHTAGYPDFILTPAVLDRDAPLEVFGPPGTRRMTDHILKAYSEDIDLRINGLEPAKPRGYEVRARDVRPGIIYRDGNVTVKAFAVSHGSWKHAYGYRFETPDKTIVISGDCTFSESVIENCNGCDILIHEVYSTAGFARREPEWQKYHAAFHTSSKQLSALASKSRPGLIVLYHQLLWGATPEQLLEEIGAGYSGRVVFGRDLDIY
ncbi:MAG: MBL fold metallo-hydrolase [Blastocatellales bacterium]